MANPLYGFSLYKSPTFSANEEYPVIGANSIAFTAGDPVIVSGGFAITQIVVGSQPLLGIAAKTVTMSSTNQTVAKVTVPIIPIDQAYTFLAGADGELSATTGPGAFFAISVDGPTGQYVGVVAATAVAFAGATTSCVLLAVDPQGLGTTGVGGGSRQGLFRFTKSVNNSGLII